MAPVLKKELVYKMLRDDIVSGRFAAGCKLPGGLDLAKRYQVAHMTVRHAVKRLAADGYVSFVNGAGTFVTYKSDQAIYLILTSNLSDVSLPGNYVIPGIQRTMSQAGAKTKLCLRDFIMEMTPDDFNAMIRRENIQGIFLMESYFHGSERELTLLKTVDIPVVMPHAVESDKTICPFSMIVADFEKAFAEALLYLRKLGHTRVATIDGIGWSFRGYPRENFEKLLKENGMERSVILESELDMEGLRDCVDRLLKARQSAVLCYSDFYAIRVIQILRERGIRIPEDISVMGFCGYPGGEYTVPKLSTLDLCYDTIGVMAAELMLRHQEWFGKSRIILESPGFLQIRESTKRYVTPTIYKDVNTTKERLSV
ncbi:MAG: LacI family DNA-binding transcriptional regulator [Lentisphaeria bacterium]|nr:LacI family DNA-binding transcriptional regulator [Lentisphaeria bacterium]